MIEVNLLPDVKQEYIKAERSRRLIISISVIVIIVSIGLLVLLLFVGALQKKHIKDLSKDIDSYSSELKSKKQISKILTVQNQLSTLTSLHDQKPAVSRVFDYINQITPTQVDISDLTFDFTKQEITISGNADSLSAVNKYIDTLKFTKYSTSGPNSQAKAFSNVVLTDYGVSSTTGAANPQASTKPTTYKLTLNYDPNLFIITTKVNLIVPSQITTRSNTDSTNELFKEAPAAQGNKR